MKNFFPGINQGKNYTFNKKNITTIIAHIKMTIQIDIMENFGTFRAFVTTKMVLNTDVGGCFICNSNSHVFTEVHKFVYCYSHHALPSF